MTISTSEPADLLREAKDPDDILTEARIAHDRQPYPTAAAYERVCALLTAAKASLSALTEALRELEQELRETGNAGYRMTSRWADQLAALHPPGETP